MLLFDTEVLTTEDPLRPGTTRFWNTPGGGVEANETWEQAALRELREETSVTDVPVGPCVWFSDGRQMRFRERFFLVEARNEGADISKLFGVEADWIKGYRWWLPDEIARSTDTFSPGHIGDLVRDLGQGRLPREPLCIDAPAGNITHEQ